METKVLSNVEIKSSLPKKYRFIRYLDEGGFGQVVQCQSKYTFQKVAVKLPLFQQDTQDEISILTRLMEEGCDQKNIIKFLEVFDTRLGKAIIFEALDMSLYDYLKTYAPLPLSTVRTIIKQVATALEELKKMSIIHTDVKLDNVMVVNRRKRPLEVKLIDFGLALPAEEAEVCSEFQVECYRPPEIILGLPWNEAVDVWCLGTLFVELLLKMRLFPNNTEYDTLRIMIKVFGAPPDHVLSQGLMTRKFFHRVGDRWVLKTCKEMENFYKHKCKTHFSERFSSLHHLVQENYPPRSHRNVAQDIKRATDLLAQMLKMEVSARITPSQILQHPFISPKSRVRKEEPQEQPDLVPQTPVRKPVVTVVKLASPENTSPFKEEEQQTDGHTEDPVSQEQPEQVQQTPVREPVVTVVKLASPENTSPFKEEEQQTDGHTEDPVSQEQPEQVQQTPVRKPVVTVVKLASPENTSPFKEEEQQTDGHTEDPVSQEQPEQVQQTPVRKPVVTVVKLASPENTSPFELDDCKPLEREQARVLPVPKRKVRPHLFRKTKVHPLPPPPAPSPEATVLPPPGDTAPKKKRTVLRRGLSWLKRFCCCSVDTKLSCKP
ncbi:homeodomain-interacting protein kinase 2-like [Boleophthalmus pectinirostris]|uniref:homeodomain-interacting protein kinase 2-like n=1 Tax=Boleophthalmus pectinirostris TaxID=150288 RepID=UPI00242A91CE|nr:homeodomain-interacting protein kinase 2-like [Boleophthalmus pectinirostris]